MTVPESPREGLSEEPAEAAGRAAGHEAARCQVQASPEAEAVERAAGLPPADERPWAGERGCCVVAEASWSLRAWVGADGRILYLSPSARQITGFSQEEIGARGLPAIAYPDDRERVERYQREALAGSRAADVQWRLVRPDGSVTWISACWEPAHNESGTLQGFRIDLRDITEQRRLAAERERLLSEASAQREFLRSVLENVPAGILILRGPQFVIEYVSPGMRAISPRPVVGHAMAEVTSIWPQIEAMVERVWQTGQPFRAAEMPYRIHRTPTAPEEEVYFTGSAVLRRGLAGQPEAVVLLVVESTAEVRARRRVTGLAHAVAREAAQLRSVLDTMVEAVFVVDSEGHLILVNPAATRLLGPAMAQKALEDMLGRLGESPMRHLDGRPVQPEETLVTRALAGETVAMEGRIAYSPQLERDVYLRGSASPIRDHLGRISGAVVVYEDLTELVEVDRLKDEFISTASHELKTPIATMKGYAEMLLRRRAEMPEGTAPPLEAIKRGADRLNRIVEDLLLASRLRVGGLALRVEPVDLTQLAQAAADRLGREAPRHHIHVAETGPVVVRGDRDQLEDVLAHLMDNAARYSPQGGDVDVSVAERNGFGVVSVKDYGVGIPRERQRRIFERFYRAHVGTPYDFGGLGVALYLSKQIVTRQGGQMWFESEEGKGSTFYFSLALAKEQTRG